VGQNKRFNSEIPIVVQGRRTIDTRNISSIDIEVSLYRRKLIKREYSKKHNLFRKDVYSKNETTCFDLYRPSSGFYNIKEESVKTA